jgi:hypothetical protein
MLSQPEFVALIIRMWRMTSTAEWVGIFCWVCGIDSSVRRPDNFWD